MHIFGIFLQGQFFEGWCIFLSVFESERTVEIGGDGAVPQEELPLPVAHPRPHRHPAHPRTEVFCMDGEKINPQQ